MAHARKADPDTSHEAAASVKDESVTKRRILTILSTGPMTDEMLVVNFHARYGALSISQSGIRSRRSELADAGLVVGFVSEDGVPIKGKTVSGRSARIWMAKEAALAALPGSLLVQE